MIKYDASQMSQLIILVTFVNVTYLSSTNLSNATYYWASLKYPILLVQSQYRFYFDSRSNLLR